MSPVIFVVSRSIFAAMSDQIGIRKIFIANGAMSVVSVMIYLVANNPLIFSIGKVFEGARNGAIWAVNRTAVFMRRSGRKAVDEVLRTQAIRTGAAAMGIIAAGFLLNSYSFDAALVFFIILSVILFSFSFLVEGEGRSKMKMKELFGQLDFRRTSNLLKKTSLVGIPQSIATAVPLSLIFPLFLKGIGYDYWLIGVAIALYYVTSALATYLFMRMRWGRRAIWAGALCFLAGGVMLPLLDGSLAVPLIAIMGIGDGMSNPLWETLVFKSVKGRRDVSSEIALLHTPANLSNSVGLIAAGVLVEMFGYGVVFLSCGVLFVLSFYLSFELLRESKYFL
jgi:MFS family permease